MRFLKIFKNITRIKEIFVCIQITSQWSQLILAYLGIKKIKFPFTFLTRNKMTIELNTFHDLVTAWIIFCRQEYKIDPLSKIIIDAGANIGTFSIFAAMKAPDAHIYALEPFPQTLEQLKRNISLNKLEARVTIIEAALSRNDGAAQMDSSDGPSQSRGLLLEDASDGITVPAISLHQLLTSKDLASVDLLKVDIEGSEHHVLPYVSQETYEKIKKLSLEYHPNGIRKDLFSSLESKNFKLIHDNRNSENSGTAWFTSIGEQ